MNKNFLFTGFITTVILFFINAIVFVAFLRDFFQTHPAVSTDFMQKLHREGSEVIPWAVIIACVSIGFLVTTVIDWSGARTFRSGLKSGFIFALLFLGSVDFGLYASSNYFSPPSVLMDFIVGTTTLGISGAIAAWLLGRRKNVKNI